MAPETMVASAIKTRVPWHDREVFQILQSLDSQDTGLTEAEAAARLAHFGPNHLPEQQSSSLWEIALRQFLNPLIYVLVAAAAVAIAMGDVKDAAFIAGVLALNAVIGSWQEWKAEVSTQALRKLLHVRAAVLRDGELIDIDAEQVVPGDVVVLESGNRVPADIRLLSSHGLEIDESLLTGESLPVQKDPSWIGESNVAVADRVNMAFAGSIISRGRAKGLVVATGTATNIGQLALDVWGSSSGKPPLLMRMERFSNAIAVVVVGAAALIGLIGVAAGNYTISQMFMYAVALAVAAIPEGLPVAMTVALAVATSRMAKRGVIVRRLAAVEGLGSCTFIATDKTGTLTCNELTVREIRLADGTVLEVTGEGFAPIGDVRQNGRPVAVGTHTGLERLIRAAVLCNEGDLHRRGAEWIWRGDAVDVALLSLGYKLGSSRVHELDRFPQINHIPYEPERQFAASFHNFESRTLSVVKGAPEKVFGSCDAAAKGDAVRRMEKGALDMAARGYRVLAIAEAELPAPCGAGDVAAEPTNLTLLGLVGMIDPLRAGAKEAVTACRRAGVSVTMVTGDHPVTALAIARQLGLADDASEVLTGVELAQLQPEKLSQLIQSVHVFARVAPHQKLQIVQAAQQAGQFVAVTGDGVNDAPALKTSNIGVAMGRSGTDVAREAAELVITDDNFATIVAGIEEGRVAFDNIRKVIYLLISTGAAEMIVMGLAIFTGLPYLPLLPVQILWLNLVTNGIQDVALAFEPSEGRILDRKPRSPREPIFNRLMIERTVVAALVMGLAGFFTFQWMVSDNAAAADIAASRNSLLLLMVLFENVHIGNCRSETKSALLLSPLRSPFLLAGALAALAVHVAAMYLPLGQAVLGTSPLGLREWIALLAIAFLVFPAMELHKLSWWLRHRK